MGIPFVAVPLLLASVMPLIGRVSKRVLPDVLANLAMLFLLGWSVFAGWETMQGGAQVWQAALQGLPLNITLTLDSFSALLLITTSLVGFCVTLYSVNYMEHYEAKGAFYALLLVMVAGMNGLVLSTDLFTIYLFLEAAAISSYGLIAFGLKQDELEASLKYLLLSVVATAVILLGIVILYGLTGTLELTKISAGLAALAEPRATGLVAGLFLMGFGLKAAMVPFHAWLPDAHSSAPAPISAMLSGVLIKVLGVYALARILLTVFGVTPELAQVLMILGCASILLGAFLALGQNDIKRMLAYSSVSQIGYIILGLGSGTAFGILGALFHILNHAAAKSLLFLNAGALEHATGTRELDKLGGLARRMPVTAGTSVIGSLAISGVPPLNGFWSKLFILIGLLQAQFYIPALVAALAGILTLWYYLILQRRAFFGALNETWSQVREAPFGMSAAVVLLSAVCILIGIAFPFALLNWVQPAAGILAGGIPHAIHFLGF